MAFMTPSERELLDDAISHMKGYLLHPASRLKEALAYIQTIREENPLAGNALLLQLMEAKRSLAGLSASTSKYDLEQQERMRKNTEGMTKASAAINQIIRQESPAGKFDLDEMLLEIYSHSDCVACYKTEAGLWLMTNLIQQAIGRYVAERKEEFFKSIMSANLNGIADTITKKEF